MGGEGEQVATPQRGIGPLTLTVTAVFCFLAGDADIALDLWARQEGEGRLVGRAALN